MKVWPAIDLLDGRCVRLYRGRYDRATEYARDPLAVAERFAVDGADGVHVVDLGGAREGRPVHAGVVLEIRQRVDVPLQVGGGLREEPHVRRYLEAGVDRVVLGTAAVREPEAVGALLRAWGPERIAAGVDVRDGRVVVEGWREEAGMERDAFLDALAALGVETVVYTDTMRDGTETAPDLDGAREVVGRGFRTLVAGGVSSADQVRELRDAGADGVVIGSALYTGALALEDALAAAAGPDREPA